MEFIKITQENLEKEHICCAITNNKDSQVISKKTWLKERLDECIRDSKEKGKKGLIILSSRKKMGFLSDYNFMTYKGFELADTAAPYFELLYLPFDKSAQKPCFRTSVKEPHGNHMAGGFALYYTNQCPFTAKYVSILEDIAKKKSVEFHANHMITGEQARNAPVPFTTFSLFYNGEFLTHEILSEKKFEKIITEKGL